MNEKIKELLNKRNELLNEAETLITAGDMEGFNAKEDEIKEQEGGSTRKKRKQRKKRERG